MISIMTDIPSNDPKIVNQEALFPQSYRKFTYPAGEMQVRLYDWAASDISSANKISVISRISSAEDFMETAQLMSAIVGLVNSEASIDLILPYLPYSRGDRRFIKGDCFGLETFALMLNSLPQDRVITLDVHSPQSAKLINNLVNVDPDMLIRAAIAYLPTDVAVIRPDEGANRYNLDRYPTYQCLKTRDATSGSILDLKVPAEDIKKHSGAIIVDDICDGGGTFIGIAERLQGMPLWLYTTHGIYSKGTELLNKHFRGLFSSDSFTTEFVGVCRIPGVSALLKV